MQIKMFIMLLVILCCADYAFDFVAEDGIGYIPKRSIKKNPSFKKFFDVRLPFVLHMQYPPKKIPPSKAVMSLHSSKTTLRKLKS